MKLSRLAVLCTVAALAAAVAEAQVAVTNVSYGALVDGADVNNQGNNNLDFQSQYSVVNTVTTGVGVYRFDGPTATSIVTRRNVSGTRPNNTTVFYQTSGAGSSDPLGQYESSVQNMFLSGNLTEGLRNPFANTGGDNAAQNSNIERIDFYLPNYTVRTNDSLVFFDLENTNNFGDGFRIAAFTSLGLVNSVADAPFTYANTGLLVAPDSFGGPINSPTAGTNGNFEAATYTNGDNLSGTVTNGNIDSIGNGLNLVGIMIRFSDLGIAAGTTIQGFSLMGADVVPTNAASLRDWNNSSTYLTNTSATGVGNMDFMGFGATVARPVPEPSTYGAIFIGASLCGWVWRRRKLAAATVLEV